MAPTQDDAARQAATRLHIIHQDAFKILVLHYLGRAARDVHHSMDTLAIDKAVVSLLLSDGDTIWPNVAIDRQHLIQDRLPSETDQIWELDTENRLGFSGPTFLFHAGLSNFAQAMWKTGSRVILSSDEERMLDSKLGGAVRSYLQALVQMGERGDPGGPGGEQEEDVVERLVEGVLGRCLRRDSGVAVDQRASGAAHTHQQHGDSAEQPTIPSSTQEST